MKKIIMLIVFVSIGMNIFSQNRVVKASYYNNKLNNKKMANGEKYNKNKLTCAHKTYVFGTNLKIKNVKNNKSVIVKVTDRGPFIKSRAIDLSYEAAKQLGILKKGVAHVEITIMKINAEYNNLDTIVERAPKIDKLPLNKSIILMVDNNIKIKSINS